MPWDFGQLFVGKTWRVPWGFSHGNHGPGEIFHGMNEKKHADNGGIYGIYGMGVP
jgi:hypothetical protein